MNKTLYVRDKDVAIWDRAKEITGGKVSDVVIELLRNWIDGRKSPQEQIEELKRRVENLESAADSKDR